MSKNINIKSNEWCDLVFKNRNKTYGAYKMRQSSSRDHMVAFGITIIFMVIISLLSLIDNDIKNFKFTERPPTICYEDTTEVVIWEYSLKMRPENWTFTPPIVIADNKVIKQTGDNKNGILYEEGEYFPIINCTDTIDRSEPIHYIPETFTKPIIESDLDDTHGNPHRTEVRPTFPGGDDELYKFLKKNLRYPSVALEMGIEGKVVICFTVSKSGKITNPRIIRSLHLACDKEAIRLIEKMPRWIPGQSAGKPVNISYILPIKFTLI